jgi:transposase
MNFATKQPKRQILIWLIWVIICLVFTFVPEQARMQGGLIVHPHGLAGMLAHDNRSRSLVPWQYPGRLRKWAWRRYCALRQAHRRAVWIARLARLALMGALTMAQVVDILTRAQLRQQLGALPVLYALLEVLGVRETINRYCPTGGKIDHGTVAVVLILNRLMAPRPLYQVADWLARTVLVYSLGVPAVQFNDDRLGRTLDALKPHIRDIWQAIVHQAYVRAKIDLSIIFYDLSAFIAHGEYAASQYVDFGFAHNTPMDKRKFKLGLDVSADGNLPAEYEAWSGRTADKATVQTNMERLCALLKRHNWPIQEVLLIGDRANLNDELALAYDDHGLHYLAGLQAQTKPHRELLEAVPEKQFYSQPLTDDHGPGGYWGLPCVVTFEHEGRQVSHRGLVVLSGPMRTALRRTRATQLRTLHQALIQVQAKIGRPHSRSVKSVQRHADTQLKKSPVGKLMRAEAYLDQDQQLCLRWWVDRYALWRAMQSDGRYLLVTNDWSLSPQRMLALYRQKDGLEKRFTVAKSDLKVSPIYLHKDDRIEAMLLINMLALLAYSLLERQARQNGLQMTTRRIIDKLESLDVIETQCWDGSRLCRIVPVDDEQTALLQALTHILAELRFPPRPREQFSSETVLLLNSPPPHHFQLVA